jgi:hypothetical protein
VVNGAANVVAVAGVVTAAEVGATVAGVVAAGAVAAVGADAAVAESAAGAVACEPGAGAVVALLAGVTGAAAAGVAAAAAVAGVGAAVPASVGAVAATAALGEGAAVAGAATAGAALEGGVTLAPAGVADTVDAGTVGAAALGGVAAVAGPDSVVAGVATGGVAGLAAGAGAGALSRAGDVAGALAGAGDVDAGVVAGAVAGAEAGTVPGALGGVAFPADGAGLGAELLSCAPSDALTASSSATWLAATSSARRDDVHMTGDSETRGIDGPSVGAARRVILSSYGAGQRLGNVLSGTTSYASGPRCRRRRGMSRVDAPVCAPRHGAPLPPSVLSARRRAGCAHAGTSASTHPDRFRGIATAVDTGGLGKHERPTTPGDQNGRMPGTTSAESRDLDHMNLVTCRTIWRLTSYYPGRSATANLRVGKGARRSLLRPRRGVASAPDRDP